MTVSDSMKVLWYAALAPVVVAVNVLSLIIIFSCKKIRNKPPALFIINLIMTHLMQGVIVMPTYAIIKSKNYPINWYPYICDIFRFTYMMTFYGTCINVLLVSSDRLLATVYIFSYRSRFRHKHFFLAIGIAWMYQLILCCLPFFSFERSQALQSSQCHYNQPNEWTIYMLVANTVVPYALILAMYLYIIKVMRQSLNDTENETGHNNERIRKGSIANVMKHHMSNTRKAYNEKVTMLTFKIMFIYGVTWTPSITYYLLVTIQGDIFNAKYYDSVLEEVLTFFIKYITFFDAVAAPMLYCYYHDDFRKAAKTFLKKIRIRRWKRTLVIQQK